MSPGSNVWDSENLEAELESEEKAADRWQSLGQDGLTTGEQDAQVLLVKLSCSEELSSRGGQPQTSQE